jgi:hypothetical protein
VAVDIVKANFRAATTAGSPHRAAYWTLVNDTEPLEGLRSSHRMVGLTNAESRSADGEVFFVQQCSVDGSDLDLPVAATPVVDGIAAERSVAVCRVGVDAEINNLPQLFIAIPPMLDRRIVCRLHTRIKEKHAGLDWKARAIALPL